MRVFDEMALSSVVWPHSTVDSDTPNSDSIRLILSTFKHSSLHVQDEFGEPKEVPYIFEAMAAILGSEDAVKERKASIRSPIARWRHWCTKGRCVTPTWT